MEDLDDLREILRDFLESRGLTVLEASNAAEGIRIAASHPCVIDLLLTDIEMPDMSGWKAAEAIAASKPGIRIVYVSAGCDEEEWQEHKAKSVESYFLQKPFGLEELNSLLRAILSK